VKKTINDADNAKGMWMLVPKLFKHANNHQPWHNKDDPHMLWFQQGTDIWGIHVPTTFIISACAFTEIS
jgi:hypothetical protein